MIDLLSKKKLRIKCEQLLSENQGLKELSSSKSVEILKLVNKLKEATDHAKNAAKETPTQPSKANL